MRKTIIAFGAIAAILLFGLNDAGPVTVHAIPANNGRYAIYLPQAGAGEGRVLLDTQTGRTWMLVHVTNEKGNNLGEFAFVPVPFLKSPQGQTTQP